MDKKLLMAANKYAKKRYKSVKKKHYFTAELSNDIYDKDRHVHDVEDMFKHRHIDGFKFDDVSHCGHGSVLFEVEVKTVVTITPYQHYVGETLVSTTPDKVHIKQQTDGRQQKDGTGSTESGTSKGTGKEKATTSGRHTEVVTAFLK